MKHTIDAEHTPHTYTVLGSGVIGLLTAKALAAEGHNVSVVSREGKPNLSSSNTSANAIGQFLPWVPEEHRDVIFGDIDIAEVTAFSREFYEALAQHPSETGVLKVENVELVRSDSPWPEGLPEAMGVREKHLDRPVQFLDPDGQEVGFDTVLTFNTFSINARKTLAFIADQAEELGVQFSQGEIDPARLHEFDGVVINALGIGAEKVDSKKAAQYFKGHTFVLRPKAESPRLNQALSVEDLILMPREDGTVICGALYIENPDRPVPEAREAQELFKRLDKLIKDISAANLVSGLDPDLLDNSKTLVHNAGYRVEVEGSGIRIAPDEVNERVLHAYGFGGIGWSVGPHFAKKVVSMAKNLHSRKITEKE